MYYTRIGLRMYLLELCDQSAAVMGMVVVVVTVTVTATAIMATAINGAVASMQTWFLSM